MPERQYMPIPVHMPRQIGEACNKDAVVVISLDSAHQMFHTATWGRSAEDKITAAKWGEMLSTYSGGDLARSEMFEDFRTDDAAARNAERADGALLLLRTLFVRGAIDASMAQQVEQFLAANGVQYRAG